ncbi:FMN-binding protein [Flagellimonas sp. S3867]|uniref:FMN-binding protein n=1 Tax=Flagellimonas sp. S3867 TaxID=2768063 RepID=UPI001683E42F|nr:FMN-binding protein [Flagellimonas sp. S3867]
MRTRFILVVFVSMLFACKGKTEKVVKQPTIIEVEKPKKLPSEMVKISEFAGITLSDTVDINSQIRFKTIDQNGMVDTIEMEKAIKIYKTRFKSGKGDVYPIFEINNFEDAVITTVSKGYGGNIRGTFLINKNSLQIRKAEFEHIAESEGYGAAIAGTLFENQFVGATINFEKNTFGLKQNGKNIVKGENIIDGVSGATTTSKLTIDMVNDELKRYRAYFESK